MSCPVWSNFAKTILDLINIARRAAYPFAGDSQLREERQNRQSLFLSHRHSPGFWHETNATQTIPVSGRLKKLGVSKQTYSGLQPNRNLADTEMLEMFVEYRHLSNKANGPPTKRSPARGIGKRIEDAVVPIVSS